MAKKLAGERLKFSSTVDQGGNLSENGTYLTIQYDRISYFYEFRI